MGVQMPVLDGHEVTLCGMLVDDASVLRHSRSDGGHRETNGAGQFVRLLSCPDGLSALQRGDVLEFLCCVRTGRRPLSGGAAWPDHGCRHVADELGHPACQSQHRGTDGCRRHLGRHRDDRRNAGAASGHAGTDRTLSGARQTGSRWRAGPNLEPARLCRGELPNPRRGRRYHRRIHCRLGGGREVRVLHRPEIHDRRDKDADSALRSAQIRSLFLCRCAVFARLPVHLRIL